MQLEKILIGSALSIHFTRGSIINFKKKEKFIVPFDEFTKKNTAF